MAEKAPRTRLTSLANKFFGKKDGQSLMEFAGELKALTDQDVDDLVGGLESGSLTY
jgi:hypothetical protein